VTFAYPSTMLDFLFYQAFLAPYAFVESDLEGVEAPEVDTGATSTETSWDPCGVATDSSGGTCPLTCGEDFDRDCVANEAEPRPVSFLQQVQVMQCAISGNSAAAVIAGGGFMGVEIIDWDEVDEDEIPYYDRRINLGGRTGDAGEEAYIEVELLGGTQYVIVVGAQTDTGVYELSIQDITE
jgi:hypothetical protein